jgi:hypothetical protein
MNLVSTETGRVLQLVVMEEIRPLSGLYMPTLYQELADRYAFAARPQNYAEAIANGAKFQHGLLITQDREIEIKEIGVYNDGLIVDARNTEDAEFILQDFAAWAVATFALRERKTIIPKIFTSSITVEFNGTLESALKGVETITKHVSNAFAQAYDWHDININLMRLAVNADPQTVPHLRNTQFLIERRLQRPYTENRYLCTAPLRTEDHIALLEKIERTIFSEETI